MTQQEQVMNHLQAFGSITPRIAQERYKIWRLSSIIYRLRKKGWPIVTEDIPIDTENNHCGKYVLEVRR